MFVHLRDADAPDPRHAEAVTALAAAGHPTITLTAAGAGDLGRIFFFAEFATAVAGWALEINPFDQPNVQEAKDNTGPGARTRARPRTSTTARSTTLLDGLAPPGYLAIMGYLPYDDAVDARRRRAARQADRAPRRGDHLGLRPALPALDRPVPQGRARRPGASSSSSTTRTDDLEVPGHGRTRSAR